MAAAAGDNQTILELLNNIKKPIDQIPAVTNK